MQKIKFHFNTRAINLFLKYSKNDTCPWRHLGDGGFKKATHLKVRQNGYRYERFASVMDATLKCHQFSWQKTSSRTPCGHKMLLLPHWNAQFKDKEKQTRENLLQLSDYILHLSRPPLCVWAVCGCASVFVYQGLPLASQGNVKHNVPCYWYPIAKARDEREAIRAG